MFLPEHGVAEEQTPVELFLRTANSDLSIAYDQMVKDPEAYAQACATVKQVIKDSELAAKEIFDTSTITEAHAELLNKLSRNLRAKKIKDARVDRDNGVISREIYLAMKNESAYDYRRILHQST